MGPEQAWSRHCAWSALAGRRAAQLAAWRSTYLALLVVGAVCGALAFHDEEPRGTVTTILGLLGAVALSAAAVVKGTLLSPPRIRDRITARAASETVKSAVYQRLVGVPPFDGHDRDHRLEEAVAEVTARARDLAAEVALVDRGADPLPSVAGIEDYVDHRAREQRDFHARRATQHMRLERRWAAVESAVVLAAAVLSAVAGAVEGRELTVWIGVATTVTAAVAVHRAGGQHARLAASYAMTVDDLDRALRSFDPASATPKDAGRLVSRVEAILARQNDTWAMTATVQP